MSAAAPADRDGESRPVSLPASLRAFTMNRSAIDAIQRNEKGVRAVMLDRDTIEAALLKSKVPFNIQDIPQFARFAEALLNDYAIGVLKSSDL